MRLNSLPGFWLGTMLVLSAALPRGAEAGITYSTFEFTNPVFAFSGTADVTISNQSANGYVLSAEFCQTGSCSGDTFTTDTLRLTNLSITCTTGSVCPAIDISFSALGSTDDPSAVFLMYLENGSFSGTAPTGFSRVCVSDEANLCSSTGVGAQSSTFTFGGGLVGTTSLSYQPNGPFSVIGDFHLDGLTNGSSVSLGNSLEVANVAPEPNDWLLIGSGLAALLLMRGLRQKGLRHRSMVR